MRILKSAFRSFVSANVALSRGFDRLLPAVVRVDGNKDFLNRIAPEALRQGMLVYDVGGGKSPLVGAQAKRSLGIRQVGLDIDRAELDRAPEGTYDEAVCADITRFRGNADGDLVICQAVLEHVTDTGAALRSIASLLKPGGLALLFIPSRNALFARLNMLLPEKTKKALLHGIYPKTKSCQGFPAYYDRCTPRAVDAAAREAGLETLELHCYYASSYFSFCFPAYVAWRAWQFVFRAVAGRQAAETFTIVLRKKAA